MLKDRTKTFQVTDTTITQYGEGRSIDDNFDNDFEALGQCRRTNKVVFFDETLNMFFCQCVFYKNHYIEELKLSLRIAKKNLQLNNNVYYKEQLELAQNKLSKLLIQ
jgi:hypothetical protein